MIILSTFSTLFHTSSLFTVDSVTVKSMFIGGNWSRLTDIKLYGQEIVPEERLKFVSMQYYNLY